MRQPPRGRRVPGGSRTPGGTPPGGQRTPQGPPRPQRTPGGHRPGGRRIPGGRPQEPPEREREQLVPGFTPRQPPEKPRVTPAPALLLPVRLETRFVEGKRGPELLVRIYPDQIAVDTHEPELTDAEIVAGTAYWDAIWRTGPTDTSTEQAAWSAFATAYGAQRAAWVALRLTPANVADRPAAATADGAPPSPAPTYPTLTDTDRRSSSWTRAPRAACLPSRWTVVTYVDGKETHRAMSARVSGPLAVGPDPQASVSASPEELQIDEGMRWMVDLDAALGAGMAVRIPLDRDEASRGLDRVIAYGIADDADATSVAALLDAHHYTDGLAFVPQGTPTNNTEDAESGYSRADPGYVTSFAVERGDPLEQSDGLVVATALGLPEETFAHVEHADGDDQLHARYMATALWPATGGYFLREMMAEVFDEDAIEAAKTFFLDRVRARGPLAAFRVGATPYGILPTTSLDLWKPTDATEVERRLAELLARLRPTWLRGAADAPHVGRSADPDADLVETLGMDASAQSVRARYVLGEGFMLNAIDLLGLGPASRWLTEQIAITSTVLARFGYGTLDPRIVHLSMTSGSYEVPPPIVQDEPVSETESLATVTFADGSEGSYIDWLRTASYRDIRDERYPTGSAPGALLYKVLRQSVLLEYATLATTAAAGTGVPGTAHLREPELVDFGARTATGLRLLDQPIGGITSGSETIGQVLDRVDVPAGRFATLGGLRLSLAALAALSTAELERLFTETLDAFSHRLDAWLTALAWAELARQREAGVAGVAVGGFGWVEDLRPRAAAPETLGYIHAPSLAQSAVAAVLRHGYESHAGTSDADLLAVDLSSDRVRVALWLIDGVRQGQSLGALLGYRSETALHDAGLDRYVQPFRDRYPLVANKLRASSETASAVAAPNVVDGLALYRDWDAGSLAWTGELPASGTDHDAIVRVLEDLADVIDGLGDLSIAESVYQVLRGNPTRAGGLLDALSRGDRAPDPDVVRTPRDAIDLTHRLLVVFAGDPPRAASWPARTNPRALAEPRLDAWLSALLPDPTRVRCRATYASGDVVQTADVALADLALTPLDVLGLADAADTPQRSELEQRIRYAALATLPDDGTDIALSFDRGTDWSTSDLSFPELLVAARALRDLAGGARALGPQDLIDPPREWSDAGGAIDTTELGARADAAVSLLAAAVDALDVALAGSDPDALRAALLAASFYGASGAIPLTRTATDDTARAALVDQATAASAALAERRDRAEALAAAFDRATAASEELRDHLVSLLEEVLGRAFVALPRCTAPDATTLATAVSRSSTLLGGDTGAPARWLQQLTHVRPGASRYDQAMTVAQLVAGASSPSFTIAQLPDEAPYRWVALPLDGETPASGRVSLAVQMVGTFDPSLALSGLLLDEWPERIPVETQTTGLAFHYDQPGAKAPQTLLLAVCPDDRTAWDDEALLAVLNETLDLAKARAVDLDTLDLVGQILPALYFAFNDTGATVSTDVLAAPTVGRT